MSQAREAKYRDQSLCHSGERVIAVIVVAITWHCMISCCCELAVVMSITSVFVVVAITHT